MCLVKCWQQNVNCGARVRGQQQLGWQHVAEAVAGILYISFRSSRVWSSILCVQRCSSLVDFSLSGRKQRVQSYKAAPNNCESFARESLCQPLPHTLLQPSLGQSVPGWVQLEALRFPGLCAALAPHTAGAPSQYCHSGPLARALGSVFHMQAPLTAASSSSQGFHTSTADTRGLARHPRATTHAWKPSPGTTAGRAPLSPQHRAGMPSPAAGADHQPGGQWGRSWGSDRQRVSSDGAAPCPTLQAAVQSVLTCSSRQEESRSAASALSGLHSKGEPTHVTADIHTVGGGTDRLQKNVL